MAVPDDTDATFRAAYRLVQTGRSAEAESLLRDALANGQEAFKTTFLLALACERNGSIDAAIEFCDRALALRPGQAMAWTRRAILLLAQKYGPAPAPRRLRRDRPAVSVSYLGSRGRFGNQLLQYGLCRLYAARHGYEYATGNWIGRRLFGFDDPMTAPQARPQPDDSEERIVAGLSAPPGSAAGGFDAVGYFAGPTGRWAHLADAFRDLYLLADPFEGIVQEAWSRLAGRGATVVAIHLRRGDFGSRRFWIAPADWYRNWLDELWPQLRDPVLYVATDDVASLQGLERFAPVTAGDIAEPVPGAEFLVDFAVLTRAPVVAISNSSFSFTATLLNRNLGTAARPDRARRSLVRYDPWSSPVLL
jgi:hypothetical protein